MYMKLLAPRGQLREPEPDRAAHHAEMGNLLSLNVRVHERRADTQELSGGFDVDGVFEILCYPGLSVRWNGRFRLAITGGLSG